MSHYKISFPHMGNYYVPFTQLLERLFPHAEIMPPPPITKETVRLGEKYSPDLICAPFKYNLGNFIQALDAGANVLLQSGNGCRYGYYGALQEQILRDLGYEFEFLCFSRGRTGLGFIYKRLKQYGCPLNPLQIANAFVSALKKIQEMDAQAAAKRESVKSENAVKVGIVGDLFTVMEPFSNFDIEKRLAGYGISVSRKLCLFSLLFGVPKWRLLQKCGGYVKNELGANGLDSVAQALEYAKAGYSGVIQMKAFGCTPELNAVPALNNISRDFGMPIMYLSFDTHTSETGIETRIEAFADMLSGGVA